MRVTCPSCQKAYNIDERRIPPGGAKLKCSSCQTLIPLRPPEAAAPPAPSAAGVRLSEGAVPLPGLGLAGAGSAPAAGMPQLTQRAPERPPVSQSLTTGVIPLPPARAPGQVPALTTAPPVPPAPRRADRTMVANPNAGAVRLPAPVASRASPAVPPPPPSVFAPPPPLAPRPASSAFGGSAVPMPSPGRSVPPPPPAPAVPPDSPLPGFEEAFSDAVEDSPDGSYGAEPLTPADAPEAPTPPAPAAPAQAAEPSHSHEDEEPWDPGTSPDFGTIDLGGDDANATALPIPADDPLPRESEVAWTEPAPPGDSLDLSDLPQTHALSDLDGPAADPLEFDPTRASAEDLEADLSQPLPGPARPAEDGLEVLGFLDEAAKEIRPRSGRVTRYHVRRRSGKVFGPFEPGVIVKMLEDGQLLGSEEVSTDGDAWTGMSGVPTFAQAMQRLVQAPSPTKAATAKPAATPPLQPPKLDLDQLAQAYGGRMAVVSVVDGEEQAEKYKRWLKLAAMVLAGLLVVGAGASLEYTSYGAFGLRWLFPGHVSASSADGKSFGDAKAALAEDAWPGLRKAQAQLEALLARKELPDLRAVWAQSVFFEQRRWGTADPAHVAQATASLEDLKILGKGHPERLRAEIGLLLMNKQPDAALALIRGAKLEGDGPLLEAEALIQKGQTADAASVLDAAMKNAPSGAGWHALGLAHLKLKKPEQAQTDFEAALKVQPQHFASAVELAQLAFARKDAVTVLTTLEPALAEPKLLAPSERSRGLALKGAALLLQSKPADGVAGLEEAVRLDPSSVFAKGTLARTYAALKQHDKSLPLWKAAVAGEPDNPVWADGQVQSLAALKKSDEALSAAAKARAAFPKDEQTALVVAQVQELLDRVTDAEKNYKAATQLDPDDLEAALGLARLYLRTRRPADARAALDPVTEKQSQNARLHLGLGDLALATGDLAAAQSEFERATTLAPDSADAWLARGRLALEKQAWKDARAHAEKAMALDPEVVNGRLVHGIALWKLGDLDGAAKDLEAARSGGPNSLLEVSLGAVYYEKGDLEKANELLQGVRRNDRGYADAYFWIARVQWKKGDIDPALDSIHDAIERAPTRAPYQYELGKILRDARRIPDAMEAWKQAVKLYPGYADAWEAMGQAYLEAGRYKESIAAFESTLKADPARARVYGLIGDAQSQAGKSKDAIASYTAGIKADPSLNSLYYRLGRAYSEMGQYDKAIAVYQRTLQVKPDDAQAWYHMGYALKEKGKKREAVEAFKNYLAKAPDAKDKKDIENEIYDLSK
jgi:predicted Zn finger-like uncharacterized protein